MTDAELKAWAQHWAVRPVAQNRMLGRAILALMADRNAVVEAKNQTVRENHALTAELARYSVSAGEADQWRAVGRAALAALGLTYEGTAPADVTQAIAELHRLNVLLAERVAVCSELLSRKAEKTS